jgi:hypothetical protein
VEGLNPTGFKEIAFGRFVMDLGLFPLNKKDINFL